MPEGLRYHLSTHDVCQQNYFVVLIFFFFFTEEAKKHNALFCGKELWGKFLKAVW